MFGGNTKQLPECIGFLVVPDFSMIAFTSAVEPLRLANRTAGKQLYEWRVMSQDGDAVSASNGVSISPDSALTPKLDGDGPMFSAIVLCSGVGAENYHNPAVSSFLHRIDRQGVDIGALCTGTHILAKAGLVSGYRCAMHWENLAAFAEDFPNIEVGANLYEIDRNRFTCSGGTAALDMMVHLIALEHGEELALKVSEQCLIDYIRPADVVQRNALRARIGGHHPKLVAAIKMMEENLEEPLSPDILAQSVGLSRRQLERLFRHHIGRSPTHYYLELRLQRARLLLIQTDLPVVDVAVACGFVSASHFSKSYRQQFDRAPRDERRHMGGAPALVQ
ncbi:MAG: GlxA family transcriptional regulator [Rhodospirillaceae bacterium]|nr:GlxA family transcriptional regulator [Rhodospirillaceae bacterium]MDD9928882.1 GlxA family transcriptional regulator [Rhodospirillaceae bacterium]